MEIEVKSLWAATQVSIKNVEKEEEGSAIQHAERVTTSVIRQVQVYPLSKRHDQFA